MAPRSLPDGAAPAGLRQKGRPQGRSRQTFQPEKTGPGRLQGQEGPLL